MADATVSATFYFSQLINHLNWWLWFWAILFFIATAAAIYFYIRFLVKRHYQRTARLGVRMPDHTIVWHTVRKNKKLVRINHGKLPNGKPDIFSYIIDPSCFNTTIRAQRVYDRRGLFWNLKGKEKDSDYDEYYLNGDWANQYGQVTIEYYYRNPYAIDYDLSYDKNLAETRARGLQEVIDDDTIQKFMNKGLLPGIFFMLMIVLIISVIILLVSGFGTFRANTCTLKADNQTLTTIYAGTHYAPAPTPAKTGTPTTATPLRTG